MNNQVFFITSNLTKLDKKLEYSSNKKLKNILTKNMKIRNDTFTVKAFSFEIVEKDLKKDDLDTQKKNIWQI